MEILHWLKSVKIVSHFDILEMEKWDSGFYYKVTESEEMTLQKAIQYVENLIEV